MSAQDRHDRLHNQQTPSPEAVGDMLRELQTSLEALATRVDALTLDIKAVESGAGRDSRRLGQEVASLGQALVERIRKVETFLTATTSGGGITLSTPVATPVVPLPTRRRRSGPWAWVLSVILAGAAAAGVWVYQSASPGDPTPATQDFVSLPGQPKATAAATGVSAPLPVKTHRALRHRRRIVVVTAEAKPTGLDSIAPAAAANPP